MALGTTFASLTLDNTAFDLGAAPGTVIGTFRGMPAGTSLTLRPQDGRFEIKGNERGWSLVVGFTAVALGTYTISVKEANPQVPGGERVTQFALRCRKPLPALPLPTGTKVMGVGHSMVQRGGFSRASGTVSQGFQESNMRTTLQWVKFLDSRFNIDIFASRGATDTAFTSDIVNPFQNLSTTNSISGAIQAIGGEHCQFLSIFNPGVLARLKYCIDRAPGIIYLQIGENDLNSDGWKDPAGLIAHLDEILKVLRDEGIWVVIQTLQIRATTLWPANDLRVILTQQVNNWIAAQTGRTGVMVCDTRSVISDSIFDSTAFNTTDFIHPNTIGGYRIGQVALPILQSMVAAGNYYNTDPTVSNIFPTSGFLGTTGTRSGANVTGQVATSWIVTSTAGTSQIVCSKEVINGSFEKQVFTITPVADGLTTHSLKMTAVSDTPFMFSSLGVAVGDWIEFLAFVELTSWSKAWQGVACFNEQYSSGGAFVWQANTGIAGDNIPAFFPTTALSGWAVTRFPVQATADRLRYSSRPFGITWYPNVGGSGVAKISQPIFRKIADPRAAWNLP